MFGKPEINATLEHQANAATQEGRVQDYASCQQVKCDDARLVAYFAIYMPDVCSYCIGLLSTLYFNLAVRRMFRLFLCANVLSL